MDFDTLKVSSNIKYDLINCFKISGQNMDSHVMVDGRLSDIVDHSWREEKLPRDDIDVPLNELPDPDADNGDTHMTLRETEAKWNDLALGILSEQHQTHN